MYKIPKRIPLINTGIITETAIWLRLNIRDEDTKATLTPNFVVNPDKINPLKNISSAKGPQTPKLKKLNIL